MTTPHYVGIRDIPEGSIVQLEGMETKFCFVRLEGIYARLEHLYGLHKGGFDYVRFDTKLQIVKED